MHSGLLASAWPTVGHLDPGLTLISLTLFAIIIPNVFNNQLYIIQMMPVRPFLTALAESLDRPCLPRCPLLALICTASLQSYPLSRRSIPLTSLNLSNPFSNQGTSSELFAYNFSSAQHI